MKLPSYSDFNYLQKVNAKCPQIPDEKTKFCSVDKNFLSFFLKHQKLFVKEAKLFFSSEIWGHFAFTFCRYLKSEYEGIYLQQVLSIRIWGYSALIFERLKTFTISSEIKGNIKLDGNVLEIALQFYSALRFARLKRLKKLREITVDFWDKVFSLSMTLTSVCPRLTTVYPTYILFEWL